MKAKPSVNNHACSLISIFELDSGETAARCCLHLSSTYKPFTGICCLSAIGR